MKTIWKQELRMIHERQEFKLPISSEILCFQFQDTTPCIWFSFPSAPEPPKVIRAFQIFGSGEMEARGDYIGTQQAGPYVWHLYELPE